MRNRTLLLIATLAILSTTLLIVPNHVAAQQETVLHSFARSSASLGLNPWAGVIRDKAGNLYGTAMDGGDFDYDGVVFELVRQKDGTYVEKILNTLSSMVDGSSPMGNLVFDASGNLYGTTAAGGGTAFELTPQEDGSWDEQLLIALSYSGSEFGGPAAGLALGADGNLYGTTYEDGYSCLPGCGSIFELVRPPAGQAWKFKTLYNFYSNENGSYPSGQLVLDSMGNLYGTTQGGGAGGTAFELAFSSDDTWTYKVIHSFGDGQDGMYPYGGLVFDDAGNLYGTTNQGGTEGRGTVFRLSPAPDGSWTETVLFHFRDRTGGTYPAYETLALDAAGNLYGTTSSGGTYNCGTVFKLAPGASAPWQETILQNLDCANGRFPMSGVVLDEAGNLYGTTNSGGAGDEGTVFEVTP